MFHVEQMQNTVVKCPVCGTNTFVNHLELDDYFFTKERFRLIKCESCGLIKTVPEPTKSEIGRYYKSEDYISHTTSIKSLKHIIYNLIRNSNLISKKRLLKQYSNGNRLLDIGCATGVFLNYCRKHGYQVQGIEPDLKARQYATDVFGITVLNLGETYKIENESFDIVTMWHVLEHVDDLNERMGLVYNALVDDGTAIIALPNPLSLDATYYGKYWAAYDVPRHLFHFTKQTFTQLANKHHFKIVNIVPMIFDAYYISLLSEKYKTGKESYFKALLHGSRSNLAAVKNNNNYSSLIYILKKEIYLEDCPQLPSYIIEI